MNTIRVRTDKWGEQWTSLRQVAAILGCSRDRAGRLVDFGLIRTRVFPVDRVLYSKSDAEQVAEKYASQRIFLSEPVPSARA